MGLLRLPATLIPPACHSAIAALPTSALPRRHACSSTSTAAASSTRRRAVATTSPIALVAQLTRTRDLSAVHYHGDWITPDCCTGGDLPGTRQIHCTLAVVASPWYVASLVGRHACGVGLSRTRKIGHHPAAPHQDAGYNRSAGRTVLRAGGAPAIRSHLRHLIGRRRRSVRDPAAPGHQHRWRAPTPRQPHHLARTAGGLAAALVFAETAARTATRT